jgi:hypothetical protein
LLNHSPLLQHHENLVNGRRGDLGCRCDVPGAHGTGAQDLEHLALIGATSGATAAASCRATRATPLSTFCCFHGQFLEHL